MEITAQPTRARRPYRMGARAAAVAETRRSIADAWIDLFRELHYDEITLDLVAARAGTTVQTVIRHFGSKEELLSAVAREAIAAETARRAEAPAGDVEGALRTLVARYDDVGEISLRLLAQEERFPAVREPTETGRRMHHDWVDRVFGPWLAGSTGARRRRLKAQLVALTDVYTWKLLRRDHRMGRGETVRAMAGMVEALLARAE